MPVVFRWGVPTSETAIPPIHQALRRFLQEKAWLVSESCGATENSKAGLGSAWLSHYG